LATLSAKLMSPRSHSTTLPAQLPAAVQRPPSTSAALALPCAVPVIALAAYAVPLTSNCASRVGYVLYTPTPGAATSTSALYCENDACALFWSVAPTDTTDAYEAG